MIERCGSVCSSDQCVLIAGHSSQCEYLPVDLADNAIVLARL